MDLIQFNRLAGVGLGGLALHPQQQEAYPATPCRI